LRRNPRSADTFPNDVVELQGYLTGNSRIPGVDATPGKGSNVPVYILGSSLFGAQLAAMLGLPYAFASHFAPAALEEAVALYRREFQPSEQLQQPYVIAGVNVIAAESQEVAEKELQAVRRARAVRFFGRARGVAEGDLDGDDELADQLLAGGAAAHVDQFLTYMAAGTAAEASRYLEGFKEHAGADELIVVFPSPSIESRLRSATLLAEAMQPLHA
ncbi:MAG: MsnO8 family LLM class oxidoreductase, partial [Candidatus Dormibacteraeota bacterium]|nr:MsnO8 family LLM class oxidoreductase [Candidatus Dormibacteraeota bacterium]